MANLLYLVHRMPYPPNKGDKVRSYHLLRHLARRHRVFVGTFVDDPDDEPLVPALRALCTELCAVRLAPRGARLRSLLGLASGAPLALHYYASAQLRAWVQRTVEQQRIDAAVVFSSPMAQYTDRHPDLPVLADLVDVDSAKWTQYADAHAWPLSWLYRLEGRRLLGYERAIVARARRSFLVTDNEVALFDRLAPECAGRVRALGNGVDAAFFEVDAARPSPFAADERAIVFTGAMDYWPNVDAVCWFAREVLPALCQRFAGLRLHIVGRNPAPEVRALASAAVAVSGTVPDVRPYLQHAAVVVAPLRLARGLQNKVLEAMAMARPVVAASPCVAAIDVREGSEILAADDAAGYLDRIARLLTDPALARAMGAAGRACVVERYSWDARLAGIDAAIAETALRQPLARGAVAEAMPT